MKHYLFRCEVRHNGITYGAGMKVPATEAECAALEKLGGVLVPEENAEKTAEKPTEAKAVRSAAKKTTKAK